jgi:hypothetical protein
LPNDDVSIMPTASRIVVCSAVEGSNQFERSKE